MRRQLNHQDQSVCAGMDPTHSTAHRVGHFIIIGTSFIMNENSLWIYKSIPPGRSKVVSCLRLGPALFLIAQHILIKPQLSFVV